MRRAFTKSIVFVSALVLVLLHSPVATTQAETAEAKTAPSGAYSLDANHASVTFKVNHLGFSRYTGRFDKLEGTLNYNAAAPEQSALDVTVYTNSINTNNVKLEEELRGDKAFDVIKFPRATFHATKIERTGAATGKITGEFTMLGKTHSVTLDTALIGQGEHPMMKKPVIGFTATGVIHRSDYGFTNWLPMVGDDVTLEIEAEFDKAE